MELDKPRFSLISAIILNFFPAGAPLFSINSIIYY